MIELSLEREEDDRFKLLYEASDMTGESPISYRVTVLLNRPDRGHHGELGLSRQELRSGGNGDYSSLFIGTDGYPVDSKSAPVSQNPRRLYDHREIFLTVDDPQLRGVIGEVFGDSRKEFEDFIAGRRMVNYTGIERS